MTDNDAFARIKNRTRATVPQRNSSLAEICNDKNTEFSQSDIKDSSQSQVTHRSSDELERRTLRIDSSIDEELQQLCSGREKITRETFLEAAYLACTLDPDLMRAVLTEARRRYRDRKQAGEQRKFETMKGKFGGQ